MFPPTTARARPWTLAACALVAVGCGRDADVTGRLLELVPTEAEVVVAIDVPVIAGGWLDRTVGGLVEGAVPACVLAAARAAPVVVVAWSDAGTLIALPGRRGPPCPELDHHGDDRVWAGGLDPAGDDDRFFADRERRRRWSALAAAPVRGLADLEVAAGVAVHAVATVDPRDGVDARMALRTDDRETLLSLRDRYLRWRAGLDHERLGAAWPAIADVTTAEDPTDPEHRTDLVTLRRRGDDGATALSLAVSALATGLGGSDPRLPCPTAFGDYDGRVTCADGELTLSRALVDELTGDPSELFEDVRLIPVSQHGAAAGIRLEALSASDALAWLGLVNGDIIDRLDGRRLSSPDDLLALYAGLLGGEPVELGVVRRGRHGVLRYRVR